MTKEVLKVKFVPVKNCFIHVTPKLLATLGKSSLVSVKLTRGNDVMFFSASSSIYSLLEHWEVGINASYARCLGLNETEVVVLSRVRNVGTVKMITACPTTPEDLDILESCSGTVEERLLSQLRVTWVGQTFPFWVCPSVCVTLIVKSTTPEVKCGILEENTEVHIESVVQNPIKELVTEASASLLFRSAFYRPEDECFLREELSGHPYDVFLKSERSPEWLRELLQKEEVFFCTLRRIDVSDKEKEIFVRLRLANGGFSGVDMGMVQSIFVSETVRTALLLGCGNRVVLKILLNPSPDEAIGIIVSYNKDEQPKCGIQEFYKAILNTVTNSGSILINTKQPYPVQHKSVVLTLRPLDVRWAVLNMANLREVDISLTCMETPPVKEVPAASSELFTLPSFEKLFSSALANVEMSLNMAQQRKGRYFYNFIVTGKAGCGKKSFVKIFLDKMSQHPNYFFTHFIECSLLKGKRIEYVTKVLQESLDLCSNHQPAILALFSLSKIASLPTADQEKAESSFTSTRLAHRIFDLINSFQRTDEILVVATSENMSSLHPRLVSPRGKSLFSSKIHIPNLTSEDREHLIKEVILQKCHSICNLQLKELHRKTDGFVAKDLVRLGQKILFESWQRKGRNYGRLKVLEDDVLNALKDCSPSSLQGCSFLTTPSQTFEDVGGFKRVKEKLIEIILWPSMYPAIIGQCPLKQQNSVLLYGAPGCGKTFLAGALAGESKLNFLSVKGPELMSKYFGESEEAVRRIFERAQSAKPCLLFFDEFDSLAPRRGSDGSGVSDRIVNQFLTALDGVEPLSGVMMIAATNRPDLIDPAILRPGRIGHSIFCNFPDEDERLEVLQKLCKLVRFSGDVDMKEVAGKTEGFSQADLKGLITSSQLKILDTKVKIPSDKDSKEFLPSPSDFRNIHVTRKDLLSCLEETKPALSAKDRAKYDAIFEQFKNKSLPETGAKKIAYA